ncbi:MAG: DUF3413 domain-containing protein, partial [Pseudomonadales bacterium]|nr:DUF3413 domain-containing protein [Pseudomonadales bacterium]
MNNRAIAFYLGSAYCLSLLLFSQFIRLPESAESLTWLFASLVLVTGPAIFMLPALLVFWFSGRPHHPEARIGGRWVLLIWLLSALVNLFLFADAKLFDLYGFHINGFVINLMMTPGGIQSLGASDGAYLMSGVFGTGIFLLHLLLLKTSERISHWQFPLSGRQLMSAMVLLLVVEKGIYAWSDLENYGPVLNQAAAVPLYKGVTARKMAGKLGYKAPDRHEVQLGNTGTELNYPLAPLQLSPPPKRPNL